MNDNYDFRKFGADKIAFLGLFIISVFIAQFLTKINSKLDFSKPIELAHSGVSLSIPTGKHWDSTQEWKYEKEEDSFVLTSYLNLGHKSPDARVICTYSSSQQNIIPIEPNMPHIKDSNSVALKTKEIVKDGLTIRWACINNPVTFLFATVELPNNRTMSIEIFEASSISEISQRIFEKMVESLSYNEENPVQEGADLVAAIKSRGIDSIINNTHIQSCFLRKDSANKNIGYSIDMLGFLNNDTNFPVRGASDLYLAEPNPREQKTMFRCDKALSNFVWQSRINTRTSRAALTITLDQSGTITLTNDITGRSRQYQNCSNVVPNILLESFVIPAIESNIDKVVIDLIDSYGNIQPTLFFLKPAENPDEGYSYIVTLKSIDESSSESFYLDENRRITKSDGNYVLERTDIGTIEKEFPGMADYISEQMKLLDSYAI